MKALKTWLTKSPAERGNLSSQSFANQPLKRAEATTVAQMLWQDWLTRGRAEREAEWKAKRITLDGKEMPFEFRIFGDAPKSGRRLFISMHGGGNAPASLNDQQWRNQISLYQPAEGVYLAPRAPTNTWNLWHEAHIDAFFDRIIEDAVLFEGVDTNRVYLMGYSAGGDGVYQVAPRMADRFAAAAMMAGHPNDASPLSLRNLPFSIQVGANDSAYDRNKIAMQWGEQLDALRKADPGGYEHTATLREGKGHWMDREDAVAVPWMSEKTRTPLPRRVIWRQDDVTHDRFYWLEVPEAQRKAGTTIRASVAGQVITIDEADVTEVTLLLNDNLLDLDKPVIVQKRDSAGATKTLFKGTVRRTVAGLGQSLSERKDPALLFPARINVKLAP